jgi:hypothetical protein
MNSVSQTDVPVTYWDSNFWRGNQNWSKIITKQVLHKNNNYDNELNIELPVVKHYTPKAKGMKENHWRDFGNGSKSGPMPWQLHDDEDDDDDDFL